MITVFISSFPTTQEVLPFKFLNLIFYPFSSNDNYYYVCIVILGEGGRLFLLLYTSLLQLDVWRNPCSVKNGPSFKMAAFSVPQCSAFLINVTLRLVS